VRRKRQPEESAFDRWGGEPFFTALIDRFYEGVAVDPLLRPMYPEALFLMQYWGGPPDYSEQRGHPRLRMRHAPFPIGKAQSDAWLRHMTDAVIAAHMDPDDQEELLEYLAMAARSLINQSA
jgi:hemoglobin